MRVELFVDGENIKLNRFVERIIGGIITGAITSLRGVGEDWNIVEIRMVREEGEKSEGNP